jgi:hypothetical protein
VELVELIVSKAAKSGLEEDKVKLHPVYLGLESAKKKELETIKAEAEAKISEMQNGFKRKETIGSVQAKARELFLSLNPVLASAADVAQNQTAVFLSKFEGYDYEFTDGGGVIVKDTTGKRLEDAHGNPVNLNQLVSSEAGKLFEFRKQDDKGNAGNAGSTGGATVTAPKNESEYLEAMISAQTPEAREAISKAWSGGATT